jgi:hypothetical protein
MPRTDVDPKGVAHRSLGYAAFFLHFITKAARWFDYVAKRRKSPGLDLRKVRYLHGYDLKEVAHR